jgi:hypothetical protein
LGNTDLEGLGLRWQWVEGQPGLSEEVIGQLGAVLDALEPVLHDGGQVVDPLRGELAQAALVV